MTFVSMGISGAGEVPQGTHLCALYSGPTERDLLMFSFLEEGLRRGDRCLCLVDGVDASSVRDRLVDRSETLERRRWEHLQVDRVSDVYMKDGSFSVDRMMSFLTDQTQLAAKGPNARLRAAGDMSWVLPRPPGAEDLFAYEPAVNRVTEGMPGVFMCMYDVNRFGVGMLVEVLKTHPRVLLDRAVLDNPHYVANYQGPRGGLPANGLHSDGPSAAAVPARHRRPLADDPWKSLTGAELRVTELVARGMSNREVAEQLTVSRHTVDAHLKHIYAKLNIHSRVELTVRALRRRTLGA